MPLKTRGDYRAGIAFSAFYALLVAFTIFMFARSVGDGELFALFWLVLTLWNGWGLTRFICLLVDYRKRGKA